MAAVAGDGCSTIETGWITLTAIGSLSRRPAALVTTTVYDPESVVSRLAKARLALVAPSSSTPSFAH